MSNTYIPLHCHSHYSLLDGFPSPKQIAQRAHEIGVPAIALTDHGSIAGIIEHQNACTKLGIKPIAGIELYIVEHDPSIRNKDNDKRYHLTVLAKNQDGIMDLIRLVNATNNPDWFYRKPRIDLKNLSQFTKNGNLICLSGCLAGELSTSLFAHDEVIINGSKYKDGVSAACSFGDNLNKIDEARSLLVNNWEDTASQIVCKYQHIFGNDNYFIEIQEEGMISQKIAVECLRKVADALKIKKIATLDSHYTRQEEAEDHRLLLCSQMHTTIEQQEQIKLQGGDTMAFWYLDSFYIFSPDEMKQHYTSEEIQGSLEIGDMVDSFGLNNKPRLPKFNNEDISDDNINSHQHLQKLCIEGAKNKLFHLSKEEKISYWQRLKYELLIIKEAKLSDYFLIVADACKFVDKNAGPRGKGRGSGAGCLVNYVLNITDIDPIQYGLFFERFYNASRNIPPHFNVGIKFMDWYGDNFTKLSQRDPEKDKKFVAKFIKQNGKIADIDHLKIEAQWIDINNPKMWHYLKDVCELEDQKLSTPAQSQMEYSIGITDVKPKIEFKPHHGHISLPDIDVDVGVDLREDLIDYLRQRWGENNVAQMITFGRLQGKAALKEVFRAQPKLVKHLMKVKQVKLGKPADDINITPHDLCNEITAHIPDEAAIADELNELREATGDDDYGILRWSIDHIDKVGEEYEWYKPLFDQAIRIEGRKKSQSKHAAGVVIADSAVEDFMPMALDTNTKTKVVGVEMNDAEAMGAVKFDFLGITALDKLWFAQKLFNQRTCVKESELVECQST